MSELTRDRVGCASCTHIAAGTLRLGGDAWGAWLPGSLLAPGAWPIHAPRVLAFTGSLSGDDDVGDPRNWMAPAADALNHCVDAGLVAARAHGQQLLLVPHAQHLLSDAHATAQWLREAHLPAGLALSPASLLVVSMLRDANDHLTRTMAQLGPSSACVLLHDLTPSTDADGESCVRSCPWKEGVLNTGLVESMLPDAPVLRMR